MSEADESGTRHGKRRRRGIFERPQASSVWWVRYHDQHGFFPERFRRRDVLLGDMIDDLLAHAATLRCFKEYRRAGRYWKDALGRRTLAQIVPGDRAIRREASGRVAPATVNRELSFLRRVFNIAIADGKAEKNPVHAVKFFKALDSKNPDIHCEAVLAAGNWEVDAAWPHVAALVTSGETDKPLLLAAIEAVASIRPHEAAEILDDLADSGDEDVVAAVDEAMAMAEGPSGEDAEDGFDDDDDSLH